MAITTPFAQNGDKKEIPQTSSDGSLSFDKGFGSLYGLPPEEGGLFIDREQFNQLVYQITEAILANQQSLSNLSGNVYNKGEVDAKVNAKANQSTTYTKTEVDNKVNAKANQSTTYTKDEVNNLVNPKADKSTTYTKTETNNLLNEKANANNVYNKSEVNTKLNAKANANAVVNLSGNQTIRDIKSFSALPVCNLSPTAGNHLANKAYVDSLNQVPDYSATINITPNKAFTAQFNGVLEVCADNASNSGWNINVSIGSTSNNQQILGMSTGSNGRFSGQIIILKGQTYYLTSIVSNLYRAIIAPFKSVTQANNAKTLSRNPPRSR